MNRILPVIFLVLLEVGILDCSAFDRRDKQSAGRIRLSENDKAAIGRKIWQNECNGTIAGLTSWNQGEDFPSLGIGHFIWYVKGRRGPFEESFPAMIVYLRQRGVRVPEWILRSDGSPWKSREEFLAEKDSARMQELRNFLAQTVPHQTGFIVQRLEQSLPKMKAVTRNPFEKRRLESNFYMMASGPIGVYALIDYVNFKGEGIKPSETYNNEGWGLQDVLLEMKPRNVPVNVEFSEAAKRVLQRRIQNSPPERGESRWLNGWMNRCESYKKGI